MASWEEEQVHLWEDLLIDRFPRLERGRFRRTSDEDSVYNCIAWAAGRTDEWWWPAPYPGPDHTWPENCPRSATVAAFVAAFRTLGYRPCRSGKLEPGVEKVVIFARPDGATGHMARQLSDGTWSSKLGPGWDIGHMDAWAVENGDYGTVKKYLKRRRASE